jgi:tripartite-type tricarboxylate transporter receptor subunit TctC
MGPAVDGTTWTGETEHESPNAAAWRRVRPAGHEPSCLGQAGWPDRLLRIVVPFAPGSFTDISARLVAVELTEQLGQSVIVENRGGAGGTAGTVAVVRAAPDGYTLLLTDTSLSISPGLYPNLPYDPVRDLAQISRIADSPSILLVRPGLGPRTLAELVALAKQKPGRSPSARAGRDRPRISRWSCCSTSRESRRCTCRSRRGGGDRGSRRRPRRHGDREPGVGLGARAGRHAPRPRRVGRAASPLLPQVPTFIEAGQGGYDMSYWWGIAAPASTPPPIIERLNREIVRACGQSRLRDAFLKQAAVAATSTPEEMTQHLAREIGVWREVITRAKVTLQ